MTPIDLLPDLGPAWTRCLCPNCGTPRYVPYGHSGGMVTPMCPACGEVFHTSRGKRLYDEALAARADGEARTADLQTKITDLEANLGSIFVELRKIRDAEIHDSPAYQGITSILALFDDAYPRPTAAPTIAADSMAATLHEIGQGMVFHLTDGPPPIDNASEAVCNARCPSSRMLLVARADDASEGWCNGFAICINCALLVGPPPAGDALERIAARVLAELPKSAPRPPHHAKRSCERTTFCDCTVCRARKGGS